MHHISYILIITILLFFSINQLEGQQLERLKATGEIPKEFITTSTSKYEKEVEQMEIKKGSAREEKDKKRFLLESNFTIDDILQSGLVLFNDTVSNYLNKVLNTLPIEDRNLMRKKPRAYVLNTSAVNAFATDQGIILVTMGLLAKLENEAQLAFILSHELMHIKNQHGIDKFLNTKNIDRNNRRESNFEQVNIDRRIFEKSLYSRQLEEEADEEGLELFLKSQYDPKAILNTFRILHYSYLPFENDFFHRSFFEDANYVFSEEVWTNEIKSTSNMSLGTEEENQRSSHPSSAKRLKKLKTRLSDMELEDKRAFIFSEAEFNGIKNQARNQIPFLELYTENFAEAIYTSYLLLKKQPDNLELKKIIGKSLYILSKYRLAGDRKILPSIANKQEGSIYQLYHLLSKMSRSEQLILTTKYNWSLYQQHPKDEELKWLIDDLFIEFASIFDSLDDFSLEALPPKIDQEEKEEVSTTDSLKTTQKLSTPIVELDVVDRTKWVKNEDQEEEGNKSTSTYWKYAFVDELKQYSFIAYFDKGTQLFKEREDLDEYYESDEGKREWRNRAKEERKFGKQLGINKIVVVNPFYLSLDERKKGVVQFIRSEQKQVYFKSDLDRISKMSNVDVTVLDVNSLSKNDIDEFNEIVEINQYFRQQMDQYDLSLTPSYNQIQVNAIADKYETDYFLWTGVIALHEKNNGWFELLSSILLPYYLPFAIAEVITPEYDMLYYAILFDVKTGRRSVIKMDFFDQKDSKGFLKAHMYDVFYQIGSEYDRKN